MKRYSFFFRYALKGLRHGGQRVLIAMFAVAFGVMSLITMGAMASAIDGAFDIDACISVEGDVRASNFNQSFDPQDLAPFQELQDEGLIDAYSPIITSFNLLLRTETSGRVYFVSSGFGIDPAVYPIAGEFMLDEPVNVAVSDLLQASGSILVTRDLAMRLDLSIGSQVRLAQPSSMAEVMPATVTGILRDTPDHMGNRIYYSTETAQVLTGDSETYYGVAMATDNQAEVVTIFENDGWYVRTVETTDMESSDALRFFGFMVRGAGILGLIVGGIGIANTMQVLLMRRRQEIGILKTLGYSQGDMIVLFVLEAALIGFGGSILGASLAILLSNSLINLLSELSSFLVSNNVELSLLLNGILIGVITAVLFATYAIVNASHVRPGVIFRQEVKAAKNWRETLKAIGFYILLSIPFAGLTIFITESVIAGIAVIVVAFAGLIVLSFVLGFIMWLVLRILPVFNFTLLRMARNGLRKRISSMLFGMIALFVGILSLGMAITMFQVVFGELFARQLEIESHNVLIYADNDNYPGIETLLDTPTVEAIEYQYVIPIQSIEAGGEELLEDTLQVRDNGYELDLIEGLPLGDNYGIYLSQYARTDSDEVTITLEDGSIHTLPVIGRYNVTWSLLDDGTTLGAPIINQATRERLNITASRVNIYVYVNSGQINQVASLVSERYPEIMTLTLSDVTDQINFVFLRFFNFAVAMSAFALVAGMVLIANIVSLALIERRYEMGVLKAVGYTRRHLLITLALEYSLVGAIASLAGVASVNVIMVFLSMVQDTEGISLMMTPTTGLIILVTGIALTLLAALSTAWKPTGVRPLIILNNN